MEAKYPVIVGRKDASIGFCTVWNKLDVVTTAAPDLLEKACIIGTLYSRQGVNPLLRNLALNPQIRTLVLWGFGPLSNTPFGRSGTDIIKALWEHGIDGDGVVATTGFHIDIEIDRAIIEHIRRSVTLVDASDNDLRTVTANLSSDTVDPYMKPIAFPPPAVKLVETFPRESVGMTIRGSTIVDTWQKAVFHVMRYGTVKGTQYGMEQRELPGLQWVIEAQETHFPEDVPADWPKELCETIGVTRENIAEYHQIFLNAEVKEGVSYTYGSRLRGWQSEHEPAPINQVQDCLIANLKRSPDSRRGVAVTFVPPIDTFAAVDTPCLLSVQALQSDGRLNLFATFRSHDIFKAAIPNAFGLLVLQQEVADATGFKRGSLSITSTSAHIYDGDFDQARKLIDCAFLERPPSKVWDASMADPRGSFVIRLEKGEIVAEHQAGDGTILGEYRGKTAREISLVLSQRCLISQLGHALDVGHELQKAEHALKLGIPYTQDPPLDFSTLKT